MLKHVAFTKNGEEKIRMYCREHRIDTDMTMHMISENADTDMPNDGIHFQCLYFDDCPALVLFRGLANDFIAWRCDSREELTKQEKDYVMEHGEWSNPILYC